MPLAPSAAPTRPPAGSPDDGVGLRERKKRETRRALHRAALELALAGGVETLTVDAIADRAGVSPRTFFNYFPTKDDAIIGAAPGDLDDLARMVSAQPAAQRPREVVRAVARQRAEAMTNDPQTWALRRALTHADPTLGLRFLGAYAQADRVLVEILVDRERQRAGGSLSPAAELAVAVETHAALGAVRAAVRAHLSGAHDVALEDLVEQAFALL